LANEKRQNNQRPDKNFDPEERGPRQRRGGQRERGTHIGNLAGAGGEGFTFYRAPMKEQVARTTTVDFTTLTSGGLPTVSSGMPSNIVVEMKISPKSGASRSVKATMDLTKTGQWPANIEVNSAGRIVSVKAHPAHHTSMEGIPVQVGGKIRVEKLFDVTTDAGQPRKERRPVEKQIKSDRVLALVYLLGATGRIRSARTDAQIKAEVFSELNFREVEARKANSTTGRGGISPVLFQAAQVPERSFDSRISGASMGLPTHAQQQGTRLQALLVGLGAPSNVLSAAESGGLEGLRSLWAEDAAAAAWAHRVGFLKADEDRSLEFPDVTVTSGVMFLWLPDGAEQTDVGFEIGDLRIRMAKDGSICVDKPAALVAKYEEEWTQLLAKCDADFAAEKKKRHEETLRHNSRSAEALGISSLQFS
jgi:hypothetical protein